jgi:hypothetical protein
MEDGCRWRRRRRRLFLLWDWGCGGSRRVMASLSDRRGYTGWKCSLTGCKDARVSESMILNRSCIFENETAFHPLYLDPSYPVITFQQGMSLDEPRFGSILLASLLEGFPWGFSFVRFSWFWTRPMCIIGVNTVCPADTAPNPDLEPDPDQMAGYRSSHLSRVIESVLSGAAGYTCSLVLTGHWRLGKFVNFLQVDDLRHDALILSGLGSLHPSLAPGHRLPLAQSPRRRRPQTRTRDATLLLPSIVLVVLRQAMPSCSPSVFCPCYLSSSAPKWILISFSYDDSADDNRPNDVIRPTERRARQCTGPPIREGCDGSTIMKAECKDISTHVDPFGGSASGINLAYAIRYLMQLVDGHTIATRGRLQTRLCAR